VISVNFGGPGTQVVRDSWKFSDPGSPQHLAWEVIEVLYPPGNELQCTPALNLTREKQTRLQK
jgi:hypothetical protein